MLDLTTAEDKAEDSRCIIVDSTRRGKRMPDALSKTIPIWCCVLNRTLFPDDTTCHNLYTPPQVVSSSEHSQILKRIDEFVGSLQSLQLDISALRKSISKPIRPMWITPESHIETSTGVFDMFHPVICCTASRRVPGGEVSEGGYIQGSGDDTENWAFGLTPQVFWQNRQLLLSTPEPDIPELIQNLCMKSSTQAAQASSLMPLKPTSCLFVMALAELDSHKLEADQICIQLTSEATEPEKWVTSSNKIVVGLGPHKVGSRNLRIALPYIIDSVTKFLLKHKSEATPSIFIACSSGKDHSVGVALALLCLLFDDNGHLLDLSEKGVIKDIDKLFIKRRLGWVMTSLPDTNPSRATLQSVNSYLMERPS